jgi:sarcosine oxidase gamma subunit
MPIPRVVVADLSGASEELALRHARAASADAWVVRAEDAGRVVVVAGDTAAQALRAALADLGIDDVALEVLPPH